MLRSGDVQRIERHHVVVELHPIAGCAGCEKQRLAGRGPGHCGIDLLGLSQSTLAREARTVRVPIHPPNAHSTPLPYSVGERVAVLIPAPNVDWLALALRVYGLPTAGLLLGVSVGTLAGEATSVALAAMGLCAGLWLGRRSVHVPQSLSLFSGPGHAALRIVNTTVQPRS